MPSLEINKKIIGEFVVYVLKGDLIVSTMLKLKNQFLKDMEEKHIYFAFDMAYVAHLDSSGMGLINNINKRVNSRNGHLVLYAFSEAVLKSLEQTGIAAGVTIVKDEEEFNNNFIL